MASDVYLDSVCAYDHTSRTDETCEGRNMSSVDLLLYTHHPQICTVSADYGQGRIGAAPSATDGSAPKGRPTW
jgi:hypothetical protein